MCWIPSDIGLKGNKKPNSAVKSALHLASDKVKIPYIDLRPKINKFYYTKWYQPWNNNIRNEFSLIKPLLEE